MRAPRIRLTDRNGLWEYALRTLAGRAHSSAELRRKLARRAEAPEDVDSVLAQLHEHGYLNDRRFAESYAAARLENDRLGQARVLQELRRRQVPDSTSRQSVGKVYEGVEENALIDEWIRRKYRAAPREGLFDNQKDLASAYRRLMRAGFRSGDVVSALKRFARDPALLDAFEPPEETEEES